MTDFPPDLPFHDAVGDDNAVQDSVAALDRAMDAAARRAGETLVTTIVAWVVKNADGSQTTGCLIGGDARPEVLEFAACAITDEAMEQPMSLARVLN